jgi:hypothetical protein
MWDLENCRVTGNYMGMFPIAGMVTESRVKYGGTVSHTVALDKPITVFGAIRECVILDNWEVSKMKTLRASILTMLRDGHTERAICATLQIRPDVVQYVIETDSDIL